MEKKLALLLGVLLLLPIAHLFGADSQVKASETKTSDPGISDDSEDGVSKRNTDQGGLLGAEDKSGEKSDPRKGLKARKLDAGSDDPKKKTTRPKKVESDGEIKMVSEKKEGTKGLNENSVRNGSGKDNDPESRSGENRDLEGTVKPSENSEDKGDEDRGNGGLKREDDCYSSYKCSDKDNVLIACLRVPGNDSPHLSLSLLIQNKGNESLTIDISAPDSVQLESTKVQLQKAENKQVEVSIGSSSGGGKQSSIVLTSGPRVCDLDFKDLMTSHGYKYLRLPARRPAIAAFLSFSALAIVGSAWMCLVSRRRKRLSRLPLGNAAYRKLDNVGIPADAPKSSENDGWDESWGDDWDDDDDEEAQPLTPSKPSPSFSSNVRLASRLSKENRKD